MKLPLDPRTVTLALKLARELYADGYDIEGFSVLREILGALADSNKLATAIRKWLVPGWFDRPDRFGDPEAARLSSAVRFLGTSGYRDEAARVLAAIPSRSARDILDAMETSTTPLKEVPSTLGKTALARELESEGSRLLAQGFSQGLTLMGTARRLSPETEWDFESIQGLVRKLPKRRPAQLNTAQAESLVLTAYDFLYSGRPEPATRIGILIPFLFQESSEPNIEKIFDEVESKTGLRTRGSSAVLKAGMTVALDLQREGYPADAANLYLDMLNIPSIDTNMWQTIWGIVEENTLRSNPATREPALGMSRFYLRSAWSKALGVSVGGPEEVSPASSGSEPAQLPPESGAIDTASSDSDDATTQESQSGDGGQQPPRPPRTGDGDKQPPDPPRTAYALLSCDEPVIAGREFPLTVGLAKDPDPYVSGSKKLERPSSSVGPYQLDVQIVADVFSLKTGESWRNQVQVTSEHPYPQFAIHLTPNFQPNKNVWSTNIQAIYSIGGQTIGIAFRSVAIVRSQEFLADAQLAVQDSGASLIIPTDQPAPDLEIRITYGEFNGKLLLTLNTPYKDISLPDDKLTVDVGVGKDAAKDFARLLVDKVDSNEGNALLYRQLIGQGRTVADAVPSEVWSVLRAVAEKKLKAPPTVLILSAEPYIPWELAVLDPPLNAELPPFLGVQAVVGRWVLAKRPKVPPPQEQTVTNIAVVSGIYDKGAWARLKEAEDEATQIQTKWLGKPVNAVVEEVKNCLDGIPPADALHFALHGIYDPNSTDNGLILVDGKSLDPDAVKGSDLKYSPFVFLNACQVGSGNSVLGDYSGMAAAFLYAGASGVVAPLWKIKDTLAKDLALRFYEATFGDMTPAEFLRQERSKFRDSSGNTSATFLAYQFFGHPSMRFHRSIERR